ncbi:MAG: hypothetical protein ABIH11_09110 [Candidatus Altiarchaeota archaeon]
MDLNYLRPTVSEIRFRCRTEEAGTEGKKEMTVRKELKQSTLV